MPRQGQSVEACTVVRWLKQPGDTVATGELLCEIETDKASFEVESTAAGTVLAHFAAEGEEVPVLTPIAAVGEPGEEAPAPGSQTAAARAAGATGAAAEQVDEPGEPGIARGVPSGSPPAAAGAGAAAGGGAEVGAGPAAASAGNGMRASGRGPASSPRARRRAAELGVDYTALAGSGPNGRIIERDVVAAAQARPALTGAARAAAAAGAPVPATGSGIGGRVTLADMAAAAAAPGAAAPGAAAPGAAAPGAVTPGAAAPHARLPRPARGARWSRRCRLRACASLSASACSSR